MPSQRYAPWIAEAVQKCNWDGVKAGLSVVYLISLLAKLSCKQMEDSMSQVLEAANSMEPIEDLDNDNGLVNAAQFLIQLNIPVHRQVSRQGMFQLVKKNRARIRNSLLQLLDVDSIREIQKLKVTPLRPELRDRIADYFHAGDRGVMLSDLVDKRGRIKPADFTDEAFTGAMVQLLFCHEAQRKPVLPEETPQSTQYLSSMLFMKSLKQVLIKSSV